MKEINKIVYETMDGKIFENKEDAEKHEKNLDLVKAYRINYNPDCNEGRGFEDYGYVLVNANANHRLFVEYWCYRKFGNHITFIMGVYGSNTITTNWEILTTTLDKVDNNKILTRIEEDFVDKLWGVK